MRGGPLDAAFGGPRAGARPSRPCASRAGFGRLRSAAALGAALAALAGAAAVQAQEAGGPAPGGDRFPTARMAPKGGYLARERLPDPVLILPPPPPAGSAEAGADRSVFEATRRLKDTGRWSLAARDAVNFLGAFDCALGFPLSQATTPRTLELLRRLGVDAAHLTNIAKEHYRRPRPFVGGSAPICVEDQREALARSASYPSGHATFAWAAAMVLAEIAPDKASTLLARGRAFAESRVVCGVHNLSDAQMGLVTGSALVAALHADPDFVSDLAGARAEISARRPGAGAAPAGPVCAAEAEAEAHTPWDNPDAAK